MIRTEKLCKLYGGVAPFCALSDVSITVEKGEFVAVTGASGAGKTTLMNILGCLDGATSGKYYLDAVNTPPGHLDTGAFPAEEAMKQRKQRWTGLGFPCARDISRESFPAVSSSGLR